MPRSAIKPVIKHDYCGKSDIKPFTVTLTQVRVPQRLPPLTAAKRLRNREAMARKRAAWAEAGIKPKAYTPQERVMGL